MLKKAVINALAALLTLALTVKAEPQRKRQYKVNKPVEKPEKEKKKKGEEKTSAKAQTEVTPPQSRTFNGATYPIAMRGMSYSPGEVKVNVKGEENPVVGIGMAQTGVTLIEFPGSDGFFAVHPPENGDLVRVEKSPSMARDRHLVLRAGRDIANAPSPAAAVTVQMRSGLSIVLWVYPVKLVTQQTHRCVFAYDRDEIVEARQRAGLAINLGEDGREVAAPPASDIATVKPGIVPVSPPVLPPAVNPDSKRSEQEPGPPNPQPATAEPIKESRSEKLLKSLRVMLKDAADHPKGFKRWSDPTNGLSVSALIRDLDENHRVALVAVKNVETDEALRLMSGQPDLVIKTMDSKGKTIQLERAKQLHTESTTTNNIIPAKATVYFAIAFAPPILGKQQRLTVTVGQKNAADDPAIAGLSAKQ